MIPIPAKPARNVFLLVFAHFSHDLCFGILPALMPFIRDAMGLNYAQAGGLIAALTIPAGLSQFLGGWFGDRYRRRLLIITGLGGVGLFTFVTGFLYSYGPLLAVFIVIGLFAGMFHPSGIVLLSDSVASTRRGRAISYFMVGGSIGYLVAPAIGGVIASQFGWHAAFSLLALPAITAAMAMALFLNSGESLQPARHAQATPARPAVRWYLIIVISILSIVMEMASGASVAFFSLFLTDARGFAALTATLGLALLRLGSLGGSLAGGQLVDRWGGLRTIILSFAISGPMLLLVSYLASVPLFFTVLLFGIFYTMREVAVEAYLLKIIPERFRSRLMGIYFGFGMEGSSLLQPVVGGAMDRFGITGVFSWLGMAASGISFLTPMLVLMGLRKKK